jgi:hypothetical protein
MQTFARCKTQASLLCASAVLACLPGAALAGFSDDQSADFSRVPLYRAYVFGGVDRNSAAQPGYASEDFIGINYASNTGPRAVANVSGSVNANGATWSGVGQSAWSGFYAGRNYAQISVNNAQVTDNYYMVAGQGSATSVQFFTPEAAAARATFTWHVSGTESNPSGIGRTTGRLDFGASTQAGVSWLNLFDDPNNQLNSITEFGPGTYTYSLPIANLGQAINLYYWSSAFAEVNPGDAPAGSSFTLTANYANTFVLEGVQLYDANDAAIDEWTLTDLNLGKAVFDQNGRIDAIAPPPPVPEPGTLALLMAGLATVASVVRRRRAV